MLKRIIFAAALAFIALLGLALVLSITLGSAVLPFTGSVAVLPIKGDITDGKPVFSSEFSASEIVETLGEADEDPSVAAVLLDIDSSGGEIVATKQIVYEVAGMKKPVVAYVGGVGASGAYYVAAASDYIVSDADSITGSIGVISTVPNIEGLLEKLGIKMETIKEGKFKDIASPFDELEPEERLILQAIIRGAFERFKNDILTFRAGKINEQGFMKIADGRILSGEQAFNQGLVDALGTRQDAIDKAAELAGIPKPARLHRYTKEEPTLLELLAGAGYSFGFGFRQGIADSSTQIPALRS